MVQPNTQTLIRRCINSFRSYVTNGYLWGGIIWLLAIGIVGYILIDKIILPIYTHQDVFIAVPQVINMSYEQAEQALFERGLEVEKIVQRFNPILPRDIVVDQNPPPNTSVKPGRFIYLTVNSGEQRMVRIPALEGLPLREAINRLRAIGILVEETLPDSIPAQYRNTVTRQDPPPGDSLAEESSVTLWYSTGLGTNYVSVPDITYLTVAEAQQILSETGLRYVVLGAGEDDENILGKRVLRQSREPGTRVLEGFEIRIFIGSGEPPSLE